MQLWCQFWYTMQETGFQFPGQESFLKLFSFTLDLQCQVAGIEAMFPLTGLISKKIKKKPLPPGKRGRGGDTTTGLECKTILHLLRLYMCV